MIFLLNKIGSKKEAKKAPVDKQARVTDTFETLIALKKVSQWSAITNPKNKKTMIVLRGIVISVFLYNIKSTINPTAISILNHTSGNASSEINSPKIAVNPQMKTIKWRCK